MIRARAAIREARPGLFPVLSESFQHQNKADTEYQSGMAAMEYQLLSAGTGQQGNPEERAEKSQQGNGKPWPGG